MTDIEDRIKRYATSAIEATPPVTAEEARSHASRRRRGGPWVKFLAVAAVIALIAGTAGIAMRDGGDTQEVATGSRDFPLTLDGYRDWRLAVINAEIEATDGELERRYTEEFLAAVPPETFRENSEALIDLGPWTVLREIERRENVLVVQLQAPGDQQARVTVMTGPDGRAVASTILMAEPCAEAVAADVALDPALAGQLEWVKALLASTEEPSEQELRDHLAPSFLSAVPVDDFKAALGQVRALGPYTYRHHEGSPLSSSLTMRVGMRTGEEARLTLAIEPRAPHRITGFAIRPQQPCRIQLPLDG